MKFEAEIFFGDEEWTKTHVNLSSDSLIYLLETLSKLNIDLTIPNLNDICAELLTSERHSYTSEGYNYFMLWMRDK